MQLEGVAGLEPALFPTAATRGGDDGWQVSAQTRADGLIVPVRVQGPHRAGEHLPGAVLWLLRLDRGDGPLVGRVLVGVAEDQGVLGLAAVPQVQPPEHRDARAE